MAATVETFPALRRAAPDLARRRSGRASLVRGALLGADLVGLAGGILVSRVEAATPWPDGAEAVAFAGLAVLWVVAAKLAGLYGGDEQRIDHSTVDELVAVAVLSTLAAWALFVAAHATGRLDGVAARLILFWGIALVAVTTCRVAVRAGLSRVASLRQRALILGSDPLARLVARKLGNHREYGVDVVGFVGDAQGDGTLGTLAELPELVRRLGIDRVVVAAGDHDSTLEAVRELRGLPVFVDLVPDLHEIVGPSGRVHSVEGLPLIDLPPARFSVSTRILKRTIDVAGALVGLALTAPLFLVLPLLIRRESPGPALFRQVRVGEGMREFTVFKFRTMRVDVDEERHRAFIAATMGAAAGPEANGLYKLERPEVTRLGAFLRRSSLDELPQLLNVLRGDMSLVGPRPCIPYELPYFEPHHFERFLVPAGITGLWQVTARAHSTFGEALDLDVAYVRGWSLGLDLNLLLRTLPRVLRRKGTA